MPVIRNNYIAHNPSGPLFSSASGGLFREEKHRSLVVEVSIMFDPQVFSLLKYVMKHVVILHHRVVPQIYLF